MLARTRLDVDALNQRARAAAATAGEVTGPVTVAGGRDWQAGDVLRARRNDRRLKLGDGHVRNGDRYQVLGPSPEDGLIVEDLLGRGRIVLPAAYVAEHVEYGWASTIDAAQDATADLGIVLVRPGMDREHLYVAMTRGRDGNHAYITPDPTSTDDDHDHGHHQRSAAVADDPQELAERVLAAALNTSGAQDAARTALEHARAIQQLHERRAEREQFGTDLVALHRILRQSREELGALPRWARGRRRSLCDAISSHELQLRQTESTLGSLDAEIDRLDRQVTHHAQQRQASGLTGPHRDRPGSWDPSRSAALIEPWPARAGDDLTAVGPSGRHEPYRGAERDVEGGLSR